MAAAASFAFTVVLPNARRVPVKIGANDALVMVRARVPLFWVYPPSHPPPAGKIVDAACAKSQFDPAAHGLKSGRRTLDLSVLCRHAGLANNGTLELVPATGRAAGAGAGARTVTVVVQTPDGQRCKVTAAPDITLWQLLR